MAIAFPFLTIGLLEIALRIGGFGTNASLFVPARFDSVHYLVPNSRFATRYFPGDPSPPTPPSDAFLREKPSNALRLIVLGESTTAGFPYASNGTFSRLLADALRDAMPNDLIEVVNVGIPATNTYAIWDELPEVIAQKPDAVLIYAGHNEWYGALGSASTVRMGASPGIIRFALALERLRTFVLMQRGIQHLRGPQSAPAAGSSRMEELATADTLRLGNDGYRRGLAQFRSNLGAILARLHDAGIPTYVASLASNLRDQPPFASDSGGVQVNANAAFAAGRTALATRGAGAESLLVRARDLDLIRFRAPSEINVAVQELAASQTAIYVPVAEAFRDADAEHVPGDSLFFEHVHPRPRGVALIARAFFESMASHSLADRIRKPPSDWSVYERGMSLTPVDSQIANTIVTALKHRWPFVSRASSANFLDTYKPQSPTDSAAFSVVAGNATWVQAKLREAERHERHGEFAAAVDEFRGLMRDQPWNESPFRFAARAYLAMNRPNDARPLLERAYTLGPTPYTCAALARVIASDSTQLPRAATLLQQALQLGGFNADALYQLSLILARQGNLPAARAAASSLYRAVPNYPGLGEWMRILQPR